MHIEADARSLSHLGHQVVLLCRDVPYPFLRPPIPASLEAQRDFLEDPNVEYIPIWGRMDSPILSYLATHLSALLKGMAAAKKKSVAGLRLGSRQFRCIVNRSFRTRCTSVFGSDRCHQQHTACEVTVLPLRLSWVLRRIECRVWYLGHSPGW